MSRFLRAAVGGLAVVVALGASTRTAPAQVLVVSAPSVDAVLGDLEYLIKAVAPDEDSARQALMGLEQFKDPKTVPGLDRTRPVGVWADLPAEQGQPPSVVAAIPVTDLDAFLKALVNFGVAVDPDAGAPGFSHKINAPGGAVSLYVVKGGNYAYFSLLPTGAEKLAALTPEAWRPKRAGASLLSLVARIDKVPDQYKQMALDQIEQAAQAEQQRKPDESDAEFRARSTGARLAMDAFKSFLNDSQTLSLDLAVDRQRGELATEMVLSARDGTTLAHSLSGFAGRSSRFQALGDAKAPMAAWVNLPIPKELSTILGDALDQGRKEAVEQAKSDDEKKAIGAVLDALRPTVTDDQVDLGLALQGPFAGQDGKPTLVLVGGLRVRDGAKLEQAFREAVKAAPNKENVEITFDAFKAADGTPVHRFKGPIDEDARRTFGDAEAFVAIRNDAVVFSFGEKAREAIEKALAAAARPAATQAEAPVALVVHVAGIAPVMEGDQREAAQQAAQAAFGGANAGKDRVQLVLRAEGATLHLRLSMDVPALKFFGMVGVLSRDVVVR
jgi:hypothetical protein